MKKLVILLIVSLCWTGVASAWDYNAEFKAKRLCAQLQELGDLVFDGKIRLDSKHIELPQRIIEIRQSVVKVVHHCLCRGLCT